MLEQAVSPPPFISILNSRIFPSLFYDQLLTYRPQFSSLSLVN